MGAAYGKKKAYSMDHEPPPKQQCVKNGKHPNGRASAYADLQQHRSEGVHRKPSPVSSYVPQPDYLEGDEEDDLIKPKKLVNPVKASKSHQELHRELMSSCKRHLQGCSKQQEKEQEENLKAPEFVKVKENLRRTSFHSKEEKEV
ncbi:protein FAM107B-like [Anarrhichthys ocellatus]|uniref:protein FAM107B-like n=1 Tax=Anarrhichthys ocellatus TaxID=433405 RepID=UPI0012ED9A3B|nr:protein FAM107B-like [Anarrhichthys ocellatus]